MNAEVVFRSGTGFQCMPRLYIPRDYSFPLVWPEAPDHITTQ